MNSEFKLMKLYPQVKIILTRDSVCAGDDCYAPHEKELKMHSFLNPQVFVREISAGYLPSVAGIGHSWTCVLNGIEIAEIRYSEIRPLIQETSFSEENFVHFSYHSASF